MEEPAHREPATRRVTSTPLTHSDEPIPERAKSHVENPMPLLVEMRDHTETCEPAARVIESGADAKGPRRKARARREGSDAAGTQLHLLARSKPPRAGAVVTTARFVAYGSFNSPWSYLASRRAGLLATVGVDVDWRSVERPVCRRGHPAGSTEELDCVRHEMTRVVATLLTRETLPYTLAGFVSDTKAATAAYAAAYRAGSATLIRPLLFEALWLHAFDLADAHTVHTLTEDALLSEESLNMTPLNLAGTTPQHQLDARWAADWVALGQPALPVLIEPGKAVLSGQDAVERLSQELMRRDVDVEDGALLGQAVCRIYLANRFS